MRLIWIKDYERIINADQILHALWRPSLYGSTERELVIFMAIPGADDNGKVGVVPYSLEIEDGPEARAIWDWLTRRACKELD